VTIKWKEVRLIYTGFKKRVSPVVLVVVCFVMLLSFSGKAQSRELTGSPKVAGNVFLDTCIGVAIGLVLGAAITASQSDPNWGSGLGAGAAVGGVGGLIFGMVYESKPLFYSDNKGMHIQFPKIAVKLEQDDVMLAKNNAMYNVNLFQHKF